MARIDPFPDSVAQDLEHLRRGTRKQYESAWTQIVGTAPDNEKAFTHDLGEIPWAVDVIRSETADGKMPVDSNATVTVAKSATTITVTNGFGETRYFRVRAM